MKKILITLMLLVGAFSGFSQTFDFSCGPDEMGEGWELYRFDYLRIDGVRWNQSANVNHEIYVAPESEFEAPIQGMYITNGGTREGTYSASVLGVSLERAYESGNIQGAVDYVRNPPFEVGGLVTYDHPGIDGASSYNPSTNILMVEGVRFPTNGATWSHRAPSRWAIGNQVVRFDINEGNYIVGFHSDGGVPTGLTGSRDFATEIRNLLTHRRVVLDIIGDEDGDHYDPNTNELRIGGVEWDYVPDEGGRDGWNAPTGWAQDGISRIRITTLGSGFYPYSIFRQGIAAEQLNNSSFSNTVEYVLELQWKPLVSGTAIYNSRANNGAGTFSVDGRNWSRSTNTGSDFADAIFTPPVGWGNVAGVNFIVRTRSSGVAFIANPELGNVPRDFDSAVVALLAKQFTGTTVANGYSDGYFYYNSVRWRRTVSGNTSTYHQPDGFRPRNFNWRITITKTGSNTPRAHYTTRAETNVATTLFDGFENFIDGLQ